MIPGYEITEELSHSRWQTLSRGLRLRDRCPVLLKRPRRSPAGLADLELLDRESSLLSELSIAGIPQAYELNRNQDHSCLVFEDRGGIPLRALLGAGSIDIERCLRIASQLAAILAELHRRDIVHANVCPQSVLIRPGPDEVILVDLHLASRSTHDNSTLPPDLFSGTLAYISPEQTGRMNRTIDYRTDLYSLGITLYEMLTGSQPCRSGDALEIIHWHIAKTPSPASELDPKIPEPVSDIVMRLLAKSAEDRYQSALGLRSDLETCLRDWSSSRNITSLVLAQHDVPDRFLIPTKLYGREKEVLALQATFDQVCQGGTSLMLVAGYSGIGKTSLVQELYRPIVRQRGYFISGKCDQVVRNVPFGALVQALRGLVHQLLSETEERLSNWRSTIIDALGSNGGVLADVIPEIEWIVGKQTPPQELGSTEALNRFQLVFQNFVAVLARPEHPLVVFLDDLQWADSATLSLLHPLLTGPDIRCLFLIGAYRDNEVDATHALTRTLGSLDAAGADVQRVSLNALGLPELTQMIRDALHSDLTDAEPLARLVLEKTGGNPYFVAQFLRTLKEEGWLEFDYDVRCWTYRIGAIAAAQTTDNVIDLMAHKVAGLSKKTQTALTLAACIGNPFEIETLAIVGDQSRYAAAKDLDEAVLEGLVSVSAREYAIQGGQNADVTLPPVASYAFSHDRVQQVAYALIPPEKKQTVHLRVGRLLVERAELNGIRLEQSDERIFDIAHHLNIGRHLITDNGERLALARLNLRTGQKAKSSTAYEVGLTYLNTGLSLLTESDWQCEYDLAFSLALEVAECEYLCGNFDEFNPQFESLLGHATTDLDRAKVYNLRTVQYENLSRRSRNQTGALGFQVSGVRCQLPEIAESGRAYV